MKRKDKIIIDELKKGNQRVLEDIYGYFPMVKKYVLKNNGTTEEAKDLFQNAIIVFYEKLMHENLELYVKISTYIFSICKNNWLKYLEREKGKKTSWDEKFNYMFAEKEEEAENMEVEKILGKVFNKLGKSCTRLLKLFYYDKLNMDVIAGKMGYNSNKTARQQKYKCIQRARQIYLDLQ